MIPTGAWQGRLQCDKAMEHQAPGSCTFHHLHNLLAELRGELMRAERQLNPGENNLIKHMKSKVLIPRLPLRC